MVYESNNTYVRTIRWAHKMHHKHLNKEDGESFWHALCSQEILAKVQDDKKRQSEHDVVQTWVHNPASLSLTCAANHYSPNLNNHYTYFLILGLPGGPAGIEF